MNNFLSIDIGGTFIKSALIDEQGQIISRDRVKTPQTELAFKKIFHEIIQANYDKIIGVGVCCPGKVNSQTGVVYYGGALTYLHRFDFKSIINEKFSLLFSIVNDGKAAALAESWLGQLKGINNGAVVVLGTGVGGGLIINGKLYQGSHFQAGELSFILQTAFTEDENAILGNTGSAVNFIKRASLILGFDDNTDGVRVFSELNQVSRQSNLYQAFIDYCQQIAYVIVQLQVILDLDKIVIGGGISAQPLVIQEIQYQYNRYQERLPIFKKNFHSIKIAACQFQNDANLIGAVYPILNEIYK